MPRRPRIDKNDPAELRAEAARLRAYSARLNDESRRASDNAPGSYVTGASGRTRAMNRRTDRALIKTIENAKKSIAAEKQADEFERHANWLENGGPEREQQRRLEAIAQRKIDRKKAQAERKEMKAGPLDERLFAGVYPAGLVMCDKAVKKNNDYRDLGILFWSTLVFRPERDCPGYWLKFLQARAAVDQLRIGEPFNWSSCQTGTLGFEHGENMSYRLFEHENALWEVTGQDHNAYCYPFGTQRSGGKCWWTNVRTIRPLILAYEAAHATGDNPIITGPDGRTYPRLETDHA